MEPKYFIAKITVDVTDMETGRVKKNKQEKLVNGISPTDVEAKVTALFENYAEEWRITAIVESKIDEVLD
jgi:hypothetical protein